MSLYSINPPADDFDSSDVHPDDLPVCRRCRESFAALTCESLCSSCGDEAQAEHEDDISFAEPLDLRLKHALVAA